MDHGGIHTEQSKDAFYDRLRPANHSRVCWASAIGGAGQIIPAHSVERAVLAATMLADGRAECLCRGDANATDVKR